LGWTPTLRSSAQVRGWTFTMWVAPDAMWVAPDADLRKWLAPSPPESGWPHLAAIWPWTLQELAERVGMSRSSFAQKFKQTVSATPIDYLTRWRMLLAGDRLANSNDPISTISLSLGYESESAFSTAFKRVMGCSPRQYSRPEPLGLREQPGSSRRSRLAVE